VDACCEWADRERIHHGRQNRSDTDISLRAVSIVTPEKLQPRKLSR
jgi:hypothetical protein